MVSHLRLAHKNCTLFYQPIQLTNNWQLMNVFAIEDVLLHCLFCEDMVVVLLYGKAVLLFV